MRTARTAIEYWWRLWLYSNNLHARLLLLEELSCTRNSATFTDTSNKDVNLSFCITPYLRACCSIVICWICRVFKLLQYDAARYRVTQCFCLADSSRHTILTWCQAHLCTISLYEVTTFHTHRLRHCEDEVITLYGTYQCQSDTCVAAGWLDDGSSWFEDALLFCIFYHSEGDSVFHATCRVEKLYLRNKGCLDALFAWEST